MIEVKYTPPTSGVPSLDSKGKSIIAKEYGKDGKNSPQYSRKEIIEILYKHLPRAYTLKLTDKTLPNSKYLDLAAEYSYPDYRILVSADLVKLDLLSSFSQYQRDFFVSHGRVLAIFNTLNSKPVSIVFRSLTDKAFLDYSLCPSVYNLDMLTADFKFGDWVIVTEGVFDADSIRPLFPNSVCMLTSNVTQMQGNILKTVSNKFIFAFDADPAGDSGFYKAQQRLTGCQVIKMPIYYADKDLGGTFEAKLRSDKEYDRRIEYYRDTLSVLCT